MNMESASQDRRSSTSNRGSGSSIGASFSWPSESGRSSGRRGQLREKREATRLLWWPIPNPTQADQPVRYATALPRSQPSPNRIKTLQPQPPWSRDHPLYVFIHLRVLTRPAGYLPHRNAVFMFLTPGGKPRLRIPPINDSIPTKS